VTGEQSFRYVGNIPARTSQLEFAASEEPWAKGVIEKQDVYGRESIVLLQPVDQVRGIIQQNLACSIANREMLNAAKAEELIRANKQKNNQPCPL
jgi:hypothetical protein